MIKAGTAPTMGGSGKGWYAFRPRKDGSMIHEYFLDGKWTEHFSDRLLYQSEDAINWSLCCAGYEWCQIGERWVDPR